MKQYVMDRFLIVLQCFQHKTLHQIYAHNIYYRNQIEISLKIQMDCINLNSNQFTKRRLQPPGKSRLHQTIFNHALLQRSNDQRIYSKS